MPTLAIRSGLYFGGTEKWNGAFQGTEMERRWPEVEREHSGAFHFPFHSKTIKIKQTTALFLYKNMFKYNYLYIRLGGTIYERINNAII